MHGIKEIKELLAFGFKLQKAIMGSLDDGKINVVTDAPKFLSALLAAPKAFGGMNLILAEIKDLSEAEREELLTFVQEEFELADQNLEYLIEDTLDQLIGIFKLAQRYSALRKK
jgi:hypothetical protein